MNNAAAAVGDARMRLPREPYPGLRPFLDFEAALLFGRQRQVREIIERLAQSQFVAVLGGSGSGKSSLIHAGVTPELRSFGIPGAGDLWLPLVCTPGTNVAAADVAARRQSPVVRLARRFAALLKSRGDPGADEARIGEIAEVFRQEAGFARLLEAYGAELDVPPGPDPAEARVLFVVDQFEEVFHPTNQGVADAAVLVERLLDHFFQPHPRCYVVITMRSEHLNDCASFLELPDAINKSSFLVRRLDANELREAIVGPAQRYLRLVARSLPEGTPLPAQVQFDDGVLQRLLRDVTAITHDPDHLPLLQHLLARLWQSALEREEMDQRVPERITPADLARAVNAAAPGVASALPDELNVLRECVHNWPERIYEWLPREAQEQLEGLLRRLAYKDPNTGAYSQQRVDVREAARLLGPAATVAQLRELLGEGFLGNVDYLFWDDDDPARTTLKVSHESFIRGWRRFKGLIDGDAVRYEAFVGVLRKCASWVEGHRHSDELLSGSELRRLRGPRLASWRASLTLPDDWLRRLRLDREAERLKRHVALLPAYLDASERQLRRRTALRYLLPLLVVLGVLGGLLLASSFTTLVQSPAMRRAELVLDAFGRAEAALVDSQYPGQAVAAAQLAQLLESAAAIDAARTGAGTRLGRTSAALIEALDWIDPVRRQGEFLQGVLAQSEPVVNEKLRTLLTTVPWAGVALPGEPPLAAPRVLEEATCRPTFGEGEQTSTGRLLVSVAARDETRGPRRALFIPSGQGEGSDLIVHAAGWNPEGGQCHFGDVALVLKHGIQARALIDSSLRFVVAVDRARGRPEDLVVLQQLQARLNPEGVPMELRSYNLMALADPVLVAAVRQTAGAERLRVAPTWAVSGGRVMAIGGQGWQLFAPQARRLAADVAGPDFVRLQAAAPQSACQQLAEALAPVPGRSLRMLDAGAMCLALYRARAEGAPAEGEEGAAGDEIGVWVYPRPTEAMVARLAERPLLPIAAVSPYARVSAGLPEDAWWALGQRGPFAGWLALRTQREGGREVAIGLPLSTCALWRQGRDVLPPGVAAAKGPLPEGLCEGR